MSVEGAVSGGGTVGLWSSPGGMEGVGLARWDVKFVTGPCSACQHVEVTPDPEGWREDGDLLATVQG